LSNLFRTSENIDDTSVDFLAVTNIGIFGYERVWGGGMSKNHMVPGFVDRN